MHITEFNFCKYLKPQKELKRLAWSKPLQKCLTGVTFGHDFLVLKLSYLFLISQNKIMYRKTYIDGML